MFEKESETKLSEEDYKLAEETIKPIYRNAIKNDYSFAKYGVECYLTGYNKGNEWHYPSKGELPKCDEETQLIFYVNCYYEVCGKPLTKKRMALGYYKKSFLRDDVKLFVEKSRGYEDEHLPQAVIAWKEIVLPKESE